MAHVHLLVFPTMRTLEPPPLTPFLPNFRRPRWIFEIADRPRDVQGLGLLHVLLLDILGLRAQGLGLRA